MLAVTTLAYKCSNNILISSILGNILATLVCEKEANIPITIEEIQEKVKKIQSNKFD